MSLKKHLSEVRAPVYILVALFAMSSWIDMYGVFVEMPILVNALPEAWGLPSYVAIIIQVANLGPLAYLLVNRLTTPGKIKEWYFVYIIIGVGCAASFSLAFLWHKTSVVSGQERSTGLLSLIGFLALVDCTSTVVFLPYMAKFKEQYTSAYFVGAELGGLITGTAGFIQGTGRPPDCLNMTVSQGNVSYSFIKPVYQPPTFTVQFFFFFIFGVMCMSGVSFTLLHFGRYCRKERVPDDLHADKLPAEMWDNAMDPSPSSGEEQQQCVDAAEARKLTNLPITAGDEAKSELVKKPRWQQVFSLAVGAWASFLAYGIIPSTQAYSTMPYGHRAYSLAVRMTSVVNPLACFLALLARTRSLALVGCLVAAATILNIFQVYLAAVSPYPPLKGTSVGVAIVVLTVVVMNACLSYSRVVVATHLRNSGGRRSLMWFGVANQGGCLVGAVATFLVVNVYKLLESESPCP